MIPLIVQNVESVIPNGCWQDLLSDLLALAQQLLSPQIVHSDEHSMKRAGQSVLHPLLPIVVFRVSILWISLLNMVSTGLTECIQFLTVAIQLCVWYLCPMQTEAIQIQKQIPETLESTEERDSNFSLDGNLWIQLGFIGTLSAFILYLFSCACPTWFDSKLHQAYLRI